MTPELKTLDDESVLFEQRVLVFIESEPQSNKYYQVILNPEQFKAMSATLGKKVSVDNEGLETYELQESEEVYTLPDLQSYNETSPQ